MHFDFLAEGWIKDLDWFEQWLNTRSFPMIIEKADGSKETMIAPGALRARRAYTYVFPRQYLQAVINSLKPARAVSCCDGKGTQMGGFTAAFLRKGLRLKKFPDIQPNGDKFQMVKENIRLIGLGYRDDIDITNKEGVTYEGL